MTDRGGRGVEKEKRVGINTESLSKVFCEMDWFMALIYKKLEDDALICLTLFAVFTVQSVIVA